MKSTGTTITIVLLVIAGIAAFIWMYMGQSEITQEQFNEQMEAVDHAPAADHTPAARDDVLVMVDGEPGLTVQEFEAFVQELEQSDPQIGMMMQMVPDFKHQLLDMKKRSVVMQAWADKNQVRDRATYREQKARMMKSLDEMLVNQLFAEDHKREVTDRDAQEYYDAHKDKEPGLMISPAGVHAQGVKFDTMAQAKAFESAVSAADMDIDAAAQTDKLFVDNFGVVTPMSMINAVVKKTLDGVKKFPSVMLVDAGKNELWVVVATEAQQAEYQPLDHVKDAIKQRLSGTKMEEMYQEEVPKLEKKYKVTVNTAHLDKEKISKEEDMRKVQEAMQAAQAQDHIEKPA